MTSVSYEELATTRARLLIQQAVVITCADECTTAEPVILFGSNAQDCGFNSTLEIILEAGDSLFESVNLVAACRAVESIKGHCDFKMTHLGTRWALGTPTEMDEPSETIGDLLDLDDDEPADWWKRGEA